MNDEPTIKLTDFDYVVGDHRLQMLKAALPYVNVPEQKALSILVKCQELMHTVSLFEEEETASMGICSLEESASRSPLDMLEAMKPYGTTSEQDFIDMICNLIQGYRLGNQYQEMKAQSTSQTQTKKAPLEQLKSFLPPEQQSRLENVSMLMQAVQQFA